MRQVRSIFISDVHLGTRGCQAEALVDFLRAYSADNLFLVGDIVDFWAMRRGIYWSRAHNTVVQKLLRRGRKGEVIRFIPGNHDEAMREYIGVVFGDIEVVSEYVHELADGRRFILMHGDEFDQVTRHHRWVAVLGDMAYNTLVLFNAWISRGRRLLGIRGYWSLASYAKSRVKKALQFVFDFEEAAIHYAQQKGLDGIICGHIHSATIREVGGKLYVNCGDWVDNCTAIVEHMDGRLELIRWGVESPQAGEKVVKAEAQPA